MTQKTTASLRSEELDREYLEETTDSFLVRVWFGCSSHPLSINEDVTSSVAHQDLLLNDETPAFGIYDPLSSEQEVRPL